LNHDWQLPSRSEACKTCGRAFEVGETFRATLYDSPAGFERCDFCLTCRPTTQAAPLGAWKTRRPQPSAPKSQPFDREAIYRLFQQLEESEDPARVRFRFVLALLLWRKRVLRFVQSQSARGGEIWHYTDLAGKLEYRVLRPELDEQQIAELSQQLERVLGGEACESDLGSSEIIETVHE
jgi:hypothetical protein